MSLVSQVAYDLDRIALNVKRIDAFVGADEKPATTPSLKKTITVPTLKPPDFVNKFAVKAVMESFTETLRAVLAGNLVLTLLLAGALQYMWGMINSLQIIVMSVLFNNLLMPENDYAIKVIIMKLTAFDFFNSEELYNRWFEFGPTPSFSDQFDEAGYGGSNFILGIGPIFLFFIGFLCFMVLHTLARKVVCKCCLRSRLVAKFVAPKPFISIAMTFMLESCI